MTRPMRWRPGFLFAAAICSALAACSDGGRGGEAGSEPETEAARADAVTPKVLLVGLDGVRVDVLAEVATPTLDALAAEGLMVTDARTTDPSVSGPSWSSMLTGVWPEKHGVTDNGFAGERYGRYPDFLTRIERVRPELSTAAIADWAPLLRSDRGVPTVSDAVDVRHVFDGYDLGWAEADALVTDLAVDLVRDSDPDALFVYLGNPDETSHQHGSIGVEYRAAIEGADAQVGRIVSAVRARPSYEREDWLILVSTDHGRRADGGHGGDTPEEMTIFIVLAGAAMRGATAPASASIVDVAATALDHLGIVIPPDWALDGRPLVDAGR